MVSRSVNTHTATMLQEPLLKFNGKWRSYQQRILDRLDYHLRDKKLHIVAAPGAGKTTLGIEVIARLRRSTLILCPTNTIKSQWRERICSSFLQEKDHGIVSTDIRKPGYLTVTTYQALLAGFCGNGNDNEDDNEDGGELNDAESIASSARFVQEKADEIIALLKAANVSLLCFDEAHHLRKEWWKALTYLNEHLQPEQTLALTATPPYDADPGEWKRYQELCGDIDEVISIPELVKNGDLCPHQDYICFSSLQQHERELLQRHNQHAKAFVERLKNDKELLDGLSKMHFFKATDADIERIFESPEFYVSIASLLNAKGYRIPQKFPDLFDARQGDLPAFDLRRASVFVKGFIETQDEEFKSFEAKKNEYLETARGLGLVANRQVVLEESPKIRKLMAGSVGKLDSIVQIVRQESSQLKERLRMVILTDYIKMDDVDCQSIGVVPIWRKLKAMANGNPQARVSIGVLCGTLILLPADTVDKLRKRLADNNIVEDTIGIGTFAGEEDYLRVTPKGSLRNQIVGLITEMFSHGDLTVLIGTQALLGEGWDAPAINSLILSSTVSSYMLSNQMRGRAIRIDRNNLDKVSNIWHLATIDPSDTSDLDQLAARFKGFEAPSYHGKHEIVSGIERVLDPRFDPKRPTGRHDVTALPRDQIRQWWKEALYLDHGQASPTALTTGVQVPPVTTKTLQYKGFRYRIILFLSIVLLLFWFLYQSMPSLIPYFLVLALIAGVLFFLVMAVRYVRTGTIEGVMKQVATTVLEAMECQGLLKSRGKNAGLQVRNDSGTVFVSATNLPAEENNLFIQSLQELLDPVDNPRYLLVKRSTFLGKIKQTDYFAVPSLLSANKKNVDLFQQIWERHVGKCEMVYTRNLAGRKLLLKARKAASSASNREKSRRLSKWQ